MFLYKFVLILDIGVYRGLSRFYMFSYVIYIYMCVCVFIRVLYVFVCAYMFLYVLHVLYFFYWT